MLLYYNSAVFTIKLNKKRYGEKICPAISAKYLCYETALGTTNELFRFLPRRKFKRISGHSSDAVGGTQMHFLLKEPAEQRDWQPINILQSLLIPLVRGAVGSSRLRAASSPSGFCSANAASLGRGRPGLFFALILLLRFSFHCKSALFPRSDCMMFNNHSP